MVSKSRTRKNKTLRLKKRSATRSLRKRGGGKTTRGKLASALGVGALLAASAYGLGKQQRNQGMNTSALTYSSNPTYSVTNKWGNTTYKPYVPGPTIPSWNNWQSKVLTPLGQKAMNVRNNYAYYTLSPEEQKKFNNQKVANKAELNAWLAEGDALEAEQSAEQKAKSNAFRAKLRKAIDDRNAREDAKEDAETKNLIASYNPSKGNDFQMKLNLKK